MLKYRFISLFLLLCCGQFIPLLAEPTAVQSTKMQENMKAAEELKQSFECKFQGGKIFKTIDYYLNNVAAHTLLSPVALKALNEFKKEFKIKLQYQSIEPVATFEHAKIHIIDPVLIISHLETGRQIRCHYNQISIYKETTDSDRYYIEREGEVRIYTGPLFPTTEAQEKEKSTPLFVITAEPSKSLYKFSEQGYIEEVKSKVHNLSFKTNAGLELFTIDALEMAANVLHRGDHMSSSVHFILEQLQIGNIAQALFSEIAPLTLVYHADYEGNYIERIDLPSLERIKKEDVDRFNGDCKLHEFSINTAGGKLILQGLTQFHKDPELPFVTVELVCKLENYRAFVEYIQKIAPFALQEQFDHAVKFLRMISVAPEDKEDQNMIITLRRGPDRKIMVGKQFEYELTSVYKKHFNQPLTIFE